MVIDTSAVVAILFDEPDQRRYGEAVEAATVRLVSAVTGRMTHHYDCFRSLPFGEDVPVPGARTAPLLLGQRQQLEAGEQRGKAGQVAIVVRVRLEIAAADESVGDATGWPRPNCPSRFDSIVP
jgi:hypothetical protein